MAWGFWSKNDGKFIRYYDVCNENMKEGFCLYKYDSELEAIGELQFKEIVYSRSFNDWEVMELPADEPEWVFFDD